jgi:SAM-dependent methyltransferase
MKTDQDNLILDKTLSLNQISSSQATILDTSYKSYLYPFLKGKVNLFMSEYLPDLKKPSAFYLSIMHQDLTKLSFNDSSLNFVISSEVFEHIHDPWLAFAEVKRVLKPGGIHIFTVPYYPGRMTSIRAVMNDKGEIKHLLAPVYHKNPLSIKGSLVFTDFGKDMIEKLYHLGLSTKIVAFSDPKLGFQETYAFISIKNITLLNNE